MKCGRTSRRGFAMVLVLIFLGVAVVLGTSYLSVASVKAASAANLVDAVRARYVAESGLEHAKYLLLSSPKEFPGPTTLGPFQIDESSDSYVINIARDKVVPGRYVVTAEGACGRARKRCSVAMYRSAGFELSVAQAAMVDSGLTTLPESLTIEGDFHTNSSLNNFAHIKGNVTAKGTIKDPEKRITGTKTEKADKQKLPSIKVDDYTSYELLGTQYDAAVRKTNVFTSDDPLANGGSIGPANVGGVVHLKPVWGGQVTLGPNLNFEGTILVDGDLIIDGENINIKAVRGFPAIVVSEKVYVTGRAKASIEGIVFARKGVAPWGVTFSSETNIRGALISTTNGYDDSLRGSHKLIHDASMASLYDLAQKSSPPFVTVLEWLE